MNPRKLLIGVATAVVAVGVVAAGVLGWRHQHRYDGVINALRVDLAAPQAYVATPSLSALPRDVVKAPVLRDVLTDDFAFYYEEQEDRLAVVGAIKRIAFEHDLGLTDRLLAIALDEPAELAWWTDAKGAPRHWLVAMTRGALARALQQAATVAASDAQLGVVATLGIHGSDVPFLALTLSPRRTLVLAAAGDRVVVLSDPGLLFDADRRPDPGSLKVVEALLADDADANAVYRRHFALPEHSSAHQIVADARFLSFGYQHFFPGLRTVRVELGPGGATLKTALRVATAAALPASTASGSSPWSALPIDPAACAVVPVDWTQLQSVLAVAHGAPPAAAQAFADLFDGPAAVCWYARAQRQTPIVVAHARAAPPQLDAALDALLRWALPAAARDAGGVATDGVRRWQRTVLAPGGNHGDGAQASYQATLARQGPWVTFSPDDRLVALALDAQARRYPSLDDGLRPEGATLAVVSPAQLAELLRREAFKVLPPDQEVLRQAAEHQLVPRLDALARVPPARAVATGTPDAEGWVGVEWVRLDARPVVRAAATPGA